MPEPIPYRPGPIGRLVRLVLGVLCTQSAVGAGMSLIDGVSGFPDGGDGLLIAAGVAAWLTPWVYDVGLGMSLGGRWRMLVAGGLVAAAAIGMGFGAAATGFHVGLLGWIVVTLGWLGVSFLVAAVLRTPGCEMRALPHLANLLTRGSRELVACPGPLQPLDEWEARTSGRAVPYVER